MNKADKDLNLAVVISLMLITFILGGVRLAQLHAQEKPVRETRTWHVAMLERITSYPPVRVDVIDTEGVCLYVLRGWATGSGNSPTITAVPKTQLPAGVGCQ